jgi:hypothetical protein
MNMAKPSKRRTKKSEPGQVPKSADWPLSTRPGFLVRRLHQIHISLFMEACAEFRITPLQYSVLSILAASGTRLSWQQPWPSIERQPPVSSSVSTPAG